MGRKVMEGGGGGRFVNFEGVFSLWILGKFKISFWK